MPNFGVHTAESLAQRVDAIIQLLESRDANGAEIEADALLEDLKSLVAPVYDPNKRGAPRPIYAAEQAGLDLVKTRALKSAIQRALASIEANDVGQALRHCHQAQREWGLK